jgi:hypothetical protein
MSSTDSTLGFGRAQRLDMDQLCDRHAPSTGGKRARLFWLTAGLSGIEITEAGFDAACSLPTSVNGLKKLP